MSEQIDRLIDETATQLTSGVPSPALRERVRARLTPMPWWRIRMWRSALGASVVAVVVIIAMKTGSWPPADATLPAPVAPPARGAAPAARPTDVVVDQSVAEPGQRAAPRARRASIAAIRPVDEMVVEAVVEPLTTEPIAAVVASVGDIEQPMPLSIGELELRPLSLEE